MTGELTTFNCEINIMIQQINPNKAEELMSQGQVVLADVRDHDSYINEHIAGAVHLTVGALQTFCAELDKNKPILVYCYHGISSQAVAQHLLDQGFRQVYSLAGGFEAWKAHHPTSNN